MKVTAHGSAPDGTGATGRSAISAALLACSLAAALLGCQSTEHLSFFGPAGRSASDDGKPRPFGSTEAELNAPNGNGASKMLVGSGHFFAPPTNGARRRDADTATYTLNLVDASVKEASIAVLGDIFGVNYSVDPRVEGRMTLQTSQPATRRDIAELFETSLRGIGAAIVQNGGVYRVVTADLATSGGRISLAETVRRGELGNIVRLTPLKFVAAAEMKRILEPIASFGGIVRVDGARNALLLSGNEQEIAAMEEAIAVFDVNVMRGMSFAFVPVRSVEPEALVDDLNSVFATNKDGPMNGMVQFIPNKRLKSILVVSKQPEYLADAEQWVRGMDRQAVGAQRQLHTYLLRNRQAKELVEVLNTLFVRETSEVAGRADAGPRPVRAAEPLSPLQQTVAGGPPAQGFSVFGGAPFAGTAASAGPGRGFDSERFAMGAPERRSGEDGAVAASTSLGGARPDGEPRIRIVADSHPECASHHGFPQRLQARRARGRQSRRHSQPGPHRGNDLRGNSER
jgi:general secretion pathway protein D